MGMRLDNQLIMNTTPTKNLNQYSIEVLESIAKQIEEMEPIKRFGVLGTADPEMTPSAIAFEYKNPRVIDDSLIVDIEILDTPAGQDLQAKILIEQGSVCFRPAGTATLPTESTMQKLLKVPVPIGLDYKLMTIQAMSGEDDALQFPPKVEWANVEIEFDEPARPEIEYNKEHEKND